MANNKVFITGASGLIGAPILEKLISNNYNCIALSRAGIPTEIAADCLIGDLLDPESYINALDKVNTIIHLAGWISYQKRDREKLFRTNVLATRELINCALNKKVENFIYISSASALIRSGDLSLVSTQSIGNPVFNSYYAETKFLGELEVWRGAAEGLNVCILNPSIVLGYADWNHSSMQIFNKVKQGLSYYPSGSLGLVSAEDIALIILKILKEQIWNQQLLLNAETWTYNKFLNTIAEGLKKKAIKKEANPFISKIISTIDTIFSTITNQKSLITSETIKISNTSFIYDDFDAQKILNYPYQDIRSLILEITKKATS